MEIKYLLDTNFIIHYFTGREDCNILWKEITSSSPHIFVSAITVTELFSFNKLTERDILDIENFLKDIRILNVDFNIAKEAGFIRSKVKIKTPDSLISATAMLYDLTLVTENNKDFKNIEGLEIKKF